MKSPLPHQRPPPYRVTRGAAAAPQRPPRARRGENLRRDDAQRGRVPTPPRAPGGKSPREPRRRTCGPRKAPPTPRPAVAMTNRYFRRAPTSAPSGERGHRPPTHRQPERPTLAGDWPQWPPLGIKAQAGLARAAVARYKKGGGRRRSPLLGSARDYAAQQAARPRPVDLHRP